MSLDTLRIMQSYYFKIIVKRQGKRKSSVPALSNQLKKHSFGSGSDIEATTDKQCLIYTASVRTPPIIRVHLNKEQSNCTYTLVKASVLSSRQGIRQLYINLHFQMRKKVLGMRGFHGNHRCSHDNTPAATWPCRWHAAILSLPGQQTCHVTFP